MPEAAAGRPTALVLADNDPLAWALKQMLEDLGYRDVWLAANAAAALGLLAGSPPDVAILDIDLGPTGTGYDVAGHLDRHGIPYLFVTAHMHDEIAERWAGHVVLEKPIRPQSLALALLRLRQDARA